jgi:hypothetical protein
MDECDSVVRSLARTLALDREETDQLIQQHHGDLVGALRTLVKRLQSRYTLAAKTRASLQALNQKQLAQCELEAMDRAACEDAEEELLLNGSPAQWIQTYRRLKDIISKMSARYSEILKQLEAKQHEAAAGGRYAADLERDLARTREELQDAENKIKDAQAQLEAVMATVDISEDPSDVDEDAIHLRETTDGQQYTAAFRTGVQQLGIEFNISGKRLSDLIYKVLALMTDLPLDAIKERVRLPSAATIYQDTQVVEQLWRDQLLEELGFATLFSISFDGGKVGAESFLPLLISYIDAQGRPRTVTVSIPKQLDKTGKATAELITRVLHGCGLNLAFLIGVTSDAASVNKETVKHLKRIKRDSLPYPTQLEGAFFSVPGQPGLFPVGITWLNDVTHGLNNAEKKLTVFASRVISDLKQLKPAATVVHAANALLAELAATAVVPFALHPDDGSLEDVEDPDIVKRGKKFGEGTQQDKLANAVLCIGRLIATYRPLLLPVINKLCARAGVPEMSNLPGNISHRFNIKTTIASMVFPRYDQILAALSAFAEYCGNSAVFTGNKHKAMVQHIKEAISYLLHPVIRLYIGCLAALAPAANRSYTAFNVEGGFLVHRVLTLLKKTVKEYETVAKNLMDPSTREFSEFTAVAWLAYAECYGEPNMDQQRLENIWDTDCELLKNFKGYLNHFCDGGVSKFRYVGLGQRLHVFRCF